MSVWIYSLLIFFHPSRCNCLALRTAYMLRLVFIRTSGISRAHALQYWQRSTAHSASREANITNHLLLSMAALQLLPARPRTAPTSCLISASVHRPRNSAWLIWHQTGSLALACAVCMWSICFVLVTCIDHCLCGHAGRCIGVQCRQTALQWRSGWAAWAVCCIVKSLTVVY